MRTIKFRGKRLMVNEWEYGNLITRPDGGCFIETGDLRLVPLQEGTVGQFTGLHDKNQKEIFEGDIVECCSWNEFFTDKTSGNVMEPFRRKMYVRFCMGGFKMIEPMPEPMKENAWDIIFNGDVVVIGNIHDTPELLPEYKEQSAQVLS